MSGDAPLLAAAGPVIAPGVPPQVRLFVRLIEREPDNLVYYLLRGEEWLAYGQVAAARADFEAARRLAAAQMAQSGWGYLHQAYIDRAEAGLRCCGVEN